MSNKRISILSTRRRVSVPKDIMEWQNWKPGQKLALVPSGSGVLIVPVTPADETGDAEEVPTTTDDVARPNRDV